MQKQSCPYTGHNHCKALLDPRGRRQHIQKEHPGLPTKPDAEGNWPVATEKQVLRATESKSTLTFLNEAMHYIKLRRDVLRQRLAEIEELENEDILLGKEQEAVEHALRAISTPAARSHVGGASGD